MSFQKDFDSSDNEPIPEESKIKEVPISKIKGPYFNYDMEKILENEADLQLNRSIQLNRIFKKLLMNDGNIGDSIRTLINQDVSLAQVNGLEQDKRTKKLYPQIRKLHKENIELIELLKNDDAILSQIDQKLIQLKVPKLIYERQCDNCGSNERVQLHLKCTPHFNEYNADHFICAECVFSKILYCHLNELPIWQMQIKCPVPTCFHILYYEEIENAKNNIQDKHLRQQSKEKYNILQEKKCSVCCGCRPLYTLHEKTDWKHKICDICLRGYLLYINNGNQLKIDFNKYNPQAQFSQFLLNNECPFRDCLYLIKSKIYIQVYGQEIDLIVHKLLTRKILHPLQHKIFESGPRKCELPEIEKLMKRGEFTENFVIKDSISNLRKASSKIRKEDVKKKPEQKIVEAVEAVCYIEGCKEDNSKLTKRFPGCKPNCKCFVCEKHIKEFGKNLLNSMYYYLIQNYLFRAQMPNLQPESKWHTGHEMYTNRQNSFYYRKTEIYRRIIFKTREYSHRKKR